MKKSLIIVLICALLIGGWTIINKKNENKSLVEVTKVIKNPKSFVGRSVKFKAKVNKIEKDKNYTKMIVSVGDDFKSNEVEIRIKHKKKIINKIKVNDYVKIEGINTGDVQEKNLAVIKVKNIKKISYIDAESPTIFEMNIEQKVRKKRLIVKLEKIEQAANENRLYISVKNKSKNLIQLSEYNFTLYVNGVAYEYKPNNEANYRELPEKIVPKQEYSAVIPFEKADLEKADTLSVKISDIATTNYEIHYPDFEYKIK